LAAGDAFLVSDLRQVLARKASADELSLGRQRSHRPDVCCQRYSRKSLRQYRRRRIIIFAKKYGVMACFGQSKFKTADACEQSCAGKGPAERLVAPFRK